MLGLRNFRVGGLGFRVSVLQFPCVSCTQVLLLFSVAAFLLGFFLKKENPTPSHPRAIVF